MTKQPTTIRGLHHAAYRCRNSAETRAFYEDFLELPLVEALPINTTATGRQAKVLHTFYQMAEGRCRHPWDQRSHLYTFHLFS